MSGRLVCDVKISARELIRARSYDLETLSQQVSAPPMTFWNEMLLTSLGGSCSFSLGSVPISCRFRFKCSVCVSSGCLKCLGKHLK